jgi:hypothetical protein
MQMNLVTELRDYLLFLKSNPNQPYIGSEDIPISLTREIREHAFEVYRSYPDVSEIYDGLSEFECGKVPNGLRVLYSNLIRTGINDCESLRRIVLGRLYIDYLPGPNKIEWTEQDHFNYRLYERVGVEFTDDHEQEILQYALNNSLCHYVENKWMISGLGEAFLRLPELQATRFLLSLEVLLSSGKDDPWHVPVSFLQDIVEKGAFPCIGISDNYHAYVDRISKLGLASPSGGDSSTLVLTPLGKAIIQSVLAQDSIFDSLIPFYVHEEIIGSVASRFSDKADLERYKQLLEKSPIIGEQKESILLDVERLLETDNQYLNIYKSLAPSVTFVQPESKLLKTAKTCTFTTEP